MKSESSPEDYMGSRDTLLPVPLCKCTSPLKTRTTHSSLQRTTPLLFPLRVQGVMSLQWPDVSLIFHNSGTSVVCPVGNLLPLHAETSELADPKVLGRGAHILSTLQPKIPRAMGAGKEKHHLALVSDSEHKPSLGQRFRFIQGCLLGDSESQ